MPKEKIVMGLATYGRTFKLVDNFSTAVGANSSGAGEAGKYTREPGFLAYYEICEKLKSGNWTAKFDDVQKSMYAYGDGMWVGYDNVDTLFLRVNRSSFAVFDALAGLSRRITSMEKISAV